MAKFSNLPTKETRFAPIQTTGARTRTYNGGEAFARDVKSDLFVLGVTNMVGEKTFYEDAKSRDARFENLVHEATKSDPAWTARFIKFLRNDANMRSASVVAAVEYVRAGGPNGRAVIDSVIVRADEPAEVLAYYLSRYGRKIPAAVKRGIADGATRVFTERNLLKYDGVGRSTRFGDVIELTHPKPKNAIQSDLFKYALDRRHRAAEAVPSVTLKTLAQATYLDSLSGDQLLDVVLQRGPSVLEEAGYTWERLSGKVKMDAKAWEAIIPSMKTMALTRNLRNFDQAGISDEAVDYVCRKLENPEEVKASRQFPFRLYTAYREVKSDNYSKSLGRALDVTCENIPVLPGRSLVLIDVSGSMNNYVSDKSSVRRAEVGAVFGAATAVRNQGNVDLVIFGQNSAVIPFQRGTSVLKLVNEALQGQTKYGVGHGTMLWRAIVKHFDNHDRIIVFTDEQTTDSQGNYRTITYGDGPGTFAVDKVKNIHMFNLGGYAPAAQLSRRGRYEYGGFSDTTFKLIPMLEKFGYGEWPF